MANKGLNGYWTSYLILHGPKSPVESPLEDWLIHKAPAVRATQERFQIFQNEIQRYIRPNAILASIPCGVMDDLLTLNVQDIEGIKFVGIDLDIKSLELAAESAQQKGIQNLSMHHSDAWKLNNHNEFGLITSNGLNIYEPNDERVVALYDSFYKALRPGGTLVTSFLTPPPALSSESPWKNFNPEDVRKQRALFGEIIQVQWQCFRTENQTRGHLERVGFKNVRFIYDSQGMFPTVIAEKI